jgi:PAS domain S-box-containing protein
VLLLVAGNRDRALVRDRLAERYEVVDADPAAAWDEFDLCVVDAATFDRVRDALAERRRAATAYLPVLLLVPETARTAEAARVADALDGAADDVLAVPAPPAELVARAEALLRARRQSRALSLYRRAMDETNVGITISDARQADNPIVYANDGFLRMTGYDREEVVGRNHRFLQGPDSSRGAVAELREAVDDARPVVVELLNYRADGEPFWCRVTVTPVRDRSGELTHFVGFQQDVTERVERDRELEQYETVVETATEPICVLDREGRFKRVNDAMVAATGRSRTDLAGEHVSAVSDDPDHLERELREVLAGESDRAAFEASLVDADGGRHRYAVSASVLRGHDGAEGAALVAHDVTDLRDHQRRLSVLDRVLRHNLRNKLNVVLSRARQIAEESEDESVREAAAAVERAGGDLLSTSEAVRRFHGAVDPHAAGDEPVDVAAAVAEALEGLRAAHPSTRFEVDCPDEARAWGDETLLLAVEELLGDAAGADERTGLVEVSVTDLPDEDVVEVVVTDDGPGLDAEARRALARGEETPLEHTMGLGLWLVRWAVENVDGEMSVAESEDRGTSVTLRLRRAP